MSLTEELDDVLTIQEAIDEIQHQEDEMIAVFGAGDESKCTYSLGYLNRQAVFSCKTCDPLFENPAGVCYACSLRCHRNHDLIELYTKRNFKCDCGNSKFKDFKCDLQEVKENINDKNTYNHNYSGKYCTCERPYPDPDDDIEDEMIQCVICEDWFHSRHLGCLPPRSYEEMICDGCVEKNLFLRSYICLTNCGSIVVRDSESLDDVDVTTCSSSKKRKITEQNEGLSQTCKLKQGEGSENYDKTDFKAMYFKEKWRNELCKCKDCLEMYADKSVSFLTHESDTIAAYERKGKDKSSEVMNDAADEISKMDRVQQVELMQGFNELKEGLSDFFRTFSDNKKIVRKEDVDSFFEELNKRKRQGPPPGQCR